MVGWHYKGRGRCSAVFVPALMGGMSFASVINGFMISVCLQGRQSHGVGRMSCTNGVIRYVPFQHSKCIPVRVPIFSYQARMVFIRSFHGASQLISPGTFLTNADHDNTPTPLRKKGGGNIIHHGILPDSPPGKMTGRESGEITQSSFFTSSFLAGNR